MLRRFLLVAAFAALPGLVHGQTVQQLKNQPPDGVIYTLQLTDGTVLAQGGNETDWWVLTPDNTGSYVNGTWTQVGSLPAGYSPYANASETLADGRVLIEGGEYNFGNFAFTNLGAIYDPATQKWTSVKPPAGNAWFNIGDSPSSILPDGDFLLGEKFTKEMAELNPKTLKWKNLKSKGKNDFNAEEGWTLMPDGTILTVDVLDNPQSEDYDAKTGKWTSLGSTVVNLQGPQNCCGNCIPYGKHDQKCYDPPGEIGPALLMPNGSVFATGATHTGFSVAYTAIYTPGSGWAAGPEFPNNDQAADSFGSLQIDGDPLIEGNSGELYDYNPGTGDFTDTKINGEGSLPSGQILVGGYEVYNTKGSYESAWQPTISNYPSSVTPGSTYKISGTQFNGLSQANSFGDEFQCNTNFPLVQIANNSTGHVFFAKTHNHSTMAVATGSQTVSTEFDVPSNIETGASTLVVIANGIPSAPVSITVQ